MLLIEFIISYKFDTFLTPNLWDYCYEIYITNIASNQMSQELNAMQLKASNSVNFLCWNEMSEPFALTVDCLEYKKNCDGWKFLVSLFPLFLIIVEQSTLGSTEKEPSNIPKNNNHFIEFFIRFVCPGLDSKYATHWILFPVDTIPCL